MSLELQFRSEGKNDEFQSLLKINTHLLADFWDEKEIGKACLQKLKVQVLQELDGCQDITSSRSYLEYRRMKYDSWAIGEGKTEISRKLAWKNSGKFGRKVNAILQKTSTKSMWYQDW